MRIQMKTFALEFWHFHVTMEYTMDHWQSDPKAMIRGYRCLLYIHIKPVGAALSFHMFGRDLQTNSLNILRDGGGNYCNTTCLWAEKDEKCIIFSKYIAVAENPCTCWVYDCWDVHSVNRCSISPLICRKGGGLASENKDISYSKIRMYLLGGFEYNFCVFNRLRTFWIYTWLWEQADHILTRICLIDLSINFCSK